VCAICSASICQLDDTQHIPVENTSSPKFGFNSPEQSGDSQFSPEKTKYDVVPVKLSAEQEWNRFLWYTASTDAGSVVAAGLHLLLGA
jgi:hypothetical protein